MWSSVRSSLSSCVSAQRGGDVCSDDLKEAERHARLPSQRAIKTLSEHLKKTIFIRRESRCEGASGAVINPPTAGYTDSASLSLVSPAFDNDSVP